MSRLKAWWLNRLDNDSVRAWVPPYCAVWLIWALLATVWLPPVPTIEPVMGHVAYLLWVWIAIPANLAPIAGLWMRHGGSAIADMSNQLLFRDWMGLILQATGHAVCFVLLLLFQVSAWLAIANYTGPSTYAGMTLFSAVMLTPWTVGVLLLCAQCVRKIQRGMQLERRTP
ncbi:hypothetical protein [Mycobacterium sp. NPDC050041]|uniref:hypothetical protein n=1 Tax=Mycobacterium sp. NPDC050041 TaxID=3364293 RepID=UPI003C2BC181